MGVTLMTTFYHVNHEKYEGRLILGLSDMGRIAHHNDNLEAIRLTYPQTWKKFVDDVDAKVYLNAGIIIYSNKDRDHECVAFVPCLDKYCDASTMLYIFSVLKKLLMRTDKQFATIEIPNLHKMDREFEKVFCDNFYLVFNEYKKK